MPRGREPSWTMKRAIWDLRAKLGPKPEVILRDIDKLIGPDRPLYGESCPDARTVKRVIEELQTLPLDVLALLPRHVQKCRDDWPQIERQLESSKQEKHIPATAREAQMAEALEEHQHDLRRTIERWNRELWTPDAAFLHIDKLGAVGRHSVLLTGIVPPRLSWDVQDDNVVVLRIGVESVPLFDCLKEHMPKSTVWKQFTVWQRNCGELLRLCSTLLNDIRQRAERLTGMLTVRVSDGEGILKQFWQTVYTATLWKTLRGKPWLDDEAYRVSDHPNAAVTLFWAENGLARVPLNQTQSLKTAHRRLQREYEACDVAKRICKLRTNIERIEEDMHQELNLMLMARFIDGSCKVCRPLLPSSSSHRS